MAATSDTLEIIIRLRDKASRGLGTMHGRVGKLAKSFTGLKAAIAGVGVGLLARNFIQAASTAEQYRVRLNTLLGSVKEGNRAFKEMAEYASKVSYSYEEIMGSATALAGIMNGGVDEIKKWMPMIADLAAVSGVTIEQATSQMIRMYSAGAASADLFRERGVLAMIGFKSSTHYTAEETKKILIDAFNDPASKFRGVSKDLAKTWSGMLSMMGDRWFQFRNLVMDAGLFEYIKNGANIFLKLMSKLKKEGKLDEWAKSISDSVIHVFETTALGLAGIYDTTKPIINSLKKAVQSMWEGFKSLPPWIQEIGLVGAFIVGKKGKIALAAALMSTSHIKNLAAAQGMVAGEAMKQEIFNELMWKPAELDAFVKEFDEKFGDAVKNMDPEPVKDLFKSFDEAESAVGKVKVLIQHLKELKKETDAGKPEFAQTSKPKPEDAGITSARSKEETKVAIAENKTMLAALEADWEAHNIKMKEYFNERLRLLNEHFELQKSLVQAELDIETDPIKKMELRTDLAIMEQDLIRQQIRLQQDYTSAIKDTTEAQKEAADIVKDIQRRISEEAAGESLGAQQKLETEALLSMQQDEIDQLLELKAAGHSVEEELQDAHNAHMLEKEQLASNQRKQIWSVYLGSIEETLGSLTSMFMDWYKISGSKNKEMFKLFKAASIAQTMIATYASAVKAYDAMADISHVGPTLAKTEAGIAIAAGMAKVQLIRQQNLAGGGMVEGVSPHPRADNISINATAGEFVHPVHVVKHYARRGMEAIRRKLVPPEIIQAFASPGMSIPRGANLAGGGIAAMAGGSSSAGTSLSMETNIRLPEQLSFIGRRLESEIEPVIRRVLKEEMAY